MQIGKQSSVENRILARNACKIIYASGDFRRWACYDRGSFERFLRVCIFSRHGELQACHRKLSYSWLRWHFGKINLYERKSLTSPENIKAVILEIANTHIIQKPMFVVNNMKQVVRMNEILEDIYKRIVPTNKHVLKLFHFPDEMDPLQ